jgi:hypothetical protein
MRVIRIEIRGNIVTKYTVNVGGRQSGKTQKAIDMWMLNPDYKLYVCNRWQVLHRIEESIGEWTHKSALELMQKAFRNIQSLSAYGMAGIRDSKNVIIDEPSLIPSTRQQEILDSDVLDGLDTLTVFGTPSVTNNVNDILLDHVIGLSTASNKITSIIMPVGSQDSFRTVATKALELRDINRVPVCFSFNRLAFMCELDDDMDSVIDRYRRLHNMTYGSSY